MKLLETKPYNRNLIKGIIHIFPTPPLGQDITKGQFLSGV